MITPAGAREVLRIGTRGSRLALWQANAIASRLDATGVGCEIVVIRTTGDRAQTGPVPGDDSKRQFVKELEDALLDNRVDVCVHSAKDLPVDLPDGLRLSACLPRDDPRDATVLPATHAASDWTDVLQRLRHSTPKPVVGTSSVRRIAQLVPLLPNAEFAPVRGNVDTRVNKLDAGGFDALILACAGLRRLGLAARISAAIPIEQCVPAPGQGIVATEIRADDTRADRLLAQIHDPTAGRSLEAERAVVKTLGGGCQLPLGAIAVMVGEAMEIHAVVASADGSTSIRRSLRGSTPDPAALGERLGKELEAAGAGRLLEGLR